MPTNISAKRMMVLMEQARGERANLRALQEGPHSWFVWDTAERTLADEQVFQKLIELLTAAHYKFAYNSGMRRVWFGVQESDLLLRGPWISVNQ
jgi:hypothetical protein